MCRECVYRAQELGGHAFVLADPDRSKLHQRRHPRVVRRVARFHGGGRLLGLEKGLEARPKGSNLSPTANEWQGCACAYAGRRTRTALRPCTPTAGGPGPARSPV